MRKEHLFEIAERAAAPGDLVGIGTLREDVFDLIRHIKKLREENQRYRETLEEISEFRDDPDYTIEDVEYMAFMAFKALEGIK